MGASEPVRNCSQYEGKIVRLRFTSRSTNRLKPEGDKLIGFFDETTLPNGHTVTRSLAFCRRVAEGSCAMVLVSPHTFCVKLTHRDDRFTNGIGMLYDIGQRFENKAIEWVSAIVPPQATTWYQRIPSGGEGRKPQLVYVKVLGQSDELNEVEKAMNYGIRVEVLGRQMRTGLKGPEFFW